MAGVNFATGGPKAAVRSAAATGNSANAGEKEDLASFISMISRDETPFYSSIGKAKATAVLHEWQTDELATPTTGQVAEGVSYSTQNSAQAAEPFRTRLGNYTQINSKTVTVTGTKRAVDQAGVADEYAYQLKKRGVELRRDVEFGLVSSWQSSNGSGTRTFGGYQAWINHTTAVGASPATALNVLTTPGEYIVPTNQGAGIAGTWAASVTSADKNSLALSHVDTVMQAIYENGGKATRLMSSPSNRRIFSAKAQSAGSATANAGDGNVRRNIDSDGKLRQSVEVYMSDFGDIMVVPNYVMGIGKTDITNLDTTANFSAFVYDPQWFAMASLRPMQEVDLGQLGDSIIGQVVEEQTLECRNPRGAGLIFGLSGL
jgi:hypothetical protein